MNRIFVSKLYSHNFRNLASSQFSFHPHLNVFFGNNGQGKTNLIEAISLSLSTKALRPLKNVTDLIKHGANESRIQIVNSGDRAFESVVWLSAKGKKFEIEGKPVRDSANLLSRVALVSFVPEELQIVNSSSSFRRKAINQIASGFFPNYLGVYRRFEKALLSRNQILKSSYIDTKELESFNQVYAHLASEITDYRERAIRLWKPFFLVSIKEILGSSYEIDANYIPSASTQSNETLEHLSSIFMEERQRRSTLLGPHLDDLDFSLDDQNARFVASRGQARAIVLALKMAQLNALRSSRDIPTVLLLDDVAGELDPEKVGYLMKTISKQSIQTFLTTTHLEGAISNAKGAHFKIVNGTLTDH